MAGILLLIVNSQHSGAEDALKWKRQAGKAYTELLVEKLMRFFIIRNM
ncbi:hypothetical protein JQ760_028475 (plasmid) [Klebsiella pneumoniae]|nr:hypothetical protein [Klebsiella pneumoniae]MCI8108400.1 hypothetical protein [Klebsiella pneumoniae]